MERSESVVVLVQKGENENTKFKYKNYKATLTALIYLFGLFLLMITIYWKELRPCHGRNLNAKPGVEFCPTGMKEALDELVQVLWKSLQIKSGRETLDFQDFELVDEGCQIKCSAGCIIDAFVSCSLSLSGLNTCARSAFTMTFVVRDHGIVPVQSIRILNGAMNLTEVNATVSENNCNWMSQVVRKTANLSCGQNALEWSQLFPLSWKLDFQCSETFEDTYCDKEPNC